MRYWTQQNAMQASSSRKKSLLKLMLRKEIKKITKKIKRTTNKNKKNLSKRQKLWTTYLIYAKRKMKRVKCV